MSGRAVARGVVTLIAAGLVLFILTLIVNFAARWFVNRAAHGKRATREAATSGAAA